MLISIKMKKKITEIIEMPEGVKAEISDGILKLSKDGKELKRKLEHEVKQEGNKLILESETLGKREKKMIKTTAAIIRSLADGLIEKYSYKLQI